MKPMPEWKETSIGRWHYDEFVMTYYVPWACWKYVAQYGAHDERSHSGCCGARLCEAMKKVESVYRRDNP